MEFEYFSGVFSETTENIVTSTPIQTIINPGADVLVVEVPTFSDVVTKCQLTRPQGYIIEFKPNDGSHERFQKLDDTDVSRCRARVDIENVGDDGLWTLTATSDEGRVRVQQYNVTLNHTEYTGKIQFYSSKNNKITSLLLYKVQVSDPKSDMDVSSSVGQTTCYRNSRRSRSAVYFNGY